MGDAVPAATRTLRALRVLSGGPIRVDALARRLEIPRSSTYQLLDAIGAEGFATRLADGRWALGIGALELQNAVWRTDPLESHARQGLQALIATVPRDLPAVAHCAVLHGRESLYIATAHTPRMTTIVADIGVRLPASLTASGRSMLATLPLKQVRALFPNRAAFVDRTGRGPMTPTALRDMLRAEQKMGVFCERGFITEGFASVAVALPPSAMSGPAAIGLTMRESSLGDPMEFREQLADVAAMIRSLLGETSSL